MAKHPNYDNLQCIVSFHLAFTGTLPLLFWCWVPHLVHLAKEGLTFQSCGPCMQEPQLTFLKAMAFEKHNTFIKAGNELTRKFYRYQVKALCSYISNRRKCKLNLSRGKHLLLCASYQSIRFSGGPCLVDHHYQK